MTGNMVKQTNGSKSSLKSNKTANDSKIKRTFKVIGKTFLTIFLIGIITSCIVMGSMIFYVMKFENPGNVDLNSAKLDYTSIIYANDPKTGKPVEVDRIYRKENRIWVDFKNMPQNLKDAFVATEDQRFYEHEGVDWKRTFAAFANYFLHFLSSNQGGSTITQQLIKNITNNWEAKPTRKVQEIIEAMNVENYYSKDQILECYLNTIGLGEGCNGVQTASNTYFGKDVSKLDLAQCAVLAGITRSPSTYDPFKHPDRTKKRQKYVLDCMLDQKKITKGEYDKAINEKLVYNKEKVVVQRKQKQSYFIDQVIADVTNDLMTQKGYTKSYAQGLIYSQGLKIYSTVDTRIQSIVESFYKDDRNFPKLYGTVQPQSAMMIVDYTGKIVAVVGGRGQKSGNMVLDRATQSKRQTGSTIKPIADYAPALDLNLITWSTLTPNQPVGTNNGNPWPRNDNRIYGGPETTVNAIAQSINTVAVRTLQKLTPQKSFDFLTGKLGFTSLVKSRTQNGKVYSDIGLHLAIGALTDGVTLREMAGGYEIFGNKGLYIKPYTYTKVLDNQNNVILENKAHGVKAINEDTAFVMNQMLQQVVKPGATGFYATIPNMPVGAKTGTTSDNKDRWFMGLTPYYVGAVWFGYDDPKEIVVHGNNPAGMIWTAVMRQVHQGMTPKDFPTVGNVVKEVYCTESGELATKNCRSTAVGWYRLSNIPPSCHLHPATSVTTPSVSSAASSNTTNSSPTSRTSPISEPAQASSVPTE